MLNSRCRMLSLATCLSVAACTQPDARPPVPKPPVEVPYVVTHRARTSGSLAFPPTRYVYIAIAPAIATREGMEQLAHQLWYDTRADTNVAVIIYTDLHAAQFARQVANNASMRILHPRAEASRVHHDAGWYSRRAGDEHVLRAQLIMGSDTTVHIYLPFPHYP